MFTVPVLAALAAVAIATSFISGIFGMAGGMLLIGFLLMILPVPVAMVFHGVIQIAANSWRSWLWRRHINWGVVLGFGMGSVFSLVVFSSLAFVPPKWAVLMAVGLTPFVALSVPQTLARVQHPGQLGFHRQVGAGHDHAHVIVRHKGRLSRSCGLVSSGARRASCRRR